ncbi:MAG: hypothetical protein J6386_01905 [Candidatus Synoicihabitans palmerolidicus]|nr:hypothetical protein [Candidatus Synoicihabitans palmerolidicus]
MTAGLVLALTRSPVLEPATNRHIESPGSEFVTSVTCRSCHPSEHGSWTASFHRTMTQAATPETVIPDIDGLDLSLGDAKYTVSQKDGRFHVTTRFENGAEGGKSNETREIVLLTGSHHQQNFWLETGEGRTLEPFPFGWLIEDQRWAPLTDTFMCPPEGQIGRAEASWNTACINCHTTQGRMGYAGEGMIFDSKVTEFGIACESCHGEAQAHVAKHRNPVARYLARWDGKPDDTIVNPAHLSGPESALACWQYHSVWAFDSREAIAAVNDAGLGFRPGDDAFTGRFWVQPKPGPMTEKLRDCIRRIPTSFSIRSGPMGWCGSRDESTMESRLLPAFRVASIPVCPVMRCTPRIQVRWVCRRGRSISWPEGRTPTRTACSVTRLWAKLWRRIPFMPRNRWAAGVMSVICPIPLMDCWAR